MASYSLYFKKKKEHVAKIKIERVAERGAGLSGGREIPKNKKTSGGPSWGKAQMRGAMAPLGPPAATPLQQGSKSNIENPVLSKKGIKVYT